MAIAFDDGWNAVEDPDPSKGELRQEGVAVECRYVVESDEVGHYQVIAEYENGGKDVEWVVDEPEVGGWRFYRDDLEWPECPMTAPEDWPHETPVTTSVEVVRWHEWTPEEAAAAKAAREEAERKMQEAKDRADMIDALPDAVADLSEQVSTNATDSSDLADALAELSVLVSNLMETK